MESAQSRIAALEEEAAKRRKLRYLANNFTSNFMSAIELVEASELDDAAVRVKALKKGLDGWPLGRSEPKKAENR